jgi:hypothetical protein
MIAEVLSVTAVTIHYYLLKFNCIIKNIDHTEGNRFNLTKLRG